MRNFKKYCGFILVTTIMLFACSKDDDSNKSDSFLPTAAPGFKCYISGETVKNVETDNAYSTIIPGSTTIYKYNSTFNISNVNWTVLSANPPGSIVINSTSNITATVSFGENFVSGDIKAIGSDTNGQLCGPVIPINKI